MITLSYNTKDLTLLHQVIEYMGKFEQVTVLYWGLNCTLTFTAGVIPLV